MGILKCVLKEGGWFGRYGFDGREFKIRSLKGDCLIDDGSRNDNSHL